MDPITLSLPTLIVLSLSVCMFTLWVLSVFIKDVSIIDAFWGTAFVIVCWLGIITEEYHFRKVLITLLVSIWGIRLSLYLFIRNHGKPEDYRYAAMRKNSPSFTFTSLFYVFGLQGFVAFMLSAPLIMILQNTEPKSVTVFDVTGTIIWLIGFLFEAIGDLQLRNFINDKRNAGKLMRSGLWRYTRHPNYFGDAVQWWGYGVIAQSIPSSWWTLYSPALMTFLLVRVTGAKLLEKKLSKSKPGYSEYVATTNSFFPWFPHKQN
jgi:steroid 5-alpha reductase family enzyme